MDDNRRLMENDKTMAEHLLVVAAFWATPGESNELQDLVDRRVKGSGSVVTFTSEQAMQPGLLAGLRKYQLSEAADHQPRSRTTPEAAAYERGYRQSVIDNSDA